MKVKLLILCEDINYLKRISTAFNNNYSNRVDLTLYSKIDAAIDHLNNKRVDVLLCDSTIEFDFEILPNNTCYAYLIDSPDLTTYKGSKAICKYQKLDQIYHGVIELFSENMPDGIDLAVNDGNAKIITFTSPVGGVGTTSMAIAFAKMVVDHGSTALYIDLSKTGDTSDLFDGVGNTTFTDVIFSLKSQKKNMSLKVESAIRKDSSGVCYFEATNSLIEMNEFEKNDFNQLIECLLGRDLFDYIILDLNHDIDEYFINILDKSFGIVLITDGKEYSNRSMVRSMRALEIIENQYDMRFLDETYIVYNKTKGNAIAIVEYDDFALAKIPEFQLEDRQSVSNQISMGNYLKGLEI